MNREIPSFSVTDLAGRKRSWRLAAVLALALALVVAGCGGGPPRPRHPLTEHVAGKRFTVTLSLEALQQASAAGVSLPRLVARALDHINTVLPGPHTSIYLYYGPGTGIVPQTGSGGYARSGTAIAAGGSRHER
jgi:hypothetical protein